MKNSSATRRDAGYLYYSAVVFFLYCALSCSAFTVALYDSRGISGTQVGILLAAASAVSIFSPPAMGLLADKLRSKRRTLMLCLALGGVTDLLLPLFAGSFWPLLGVSVVGNAFRGATFTLFDAWLVSEASVAGRKLEYGSVRLWGSIGYSLFSLCYSAITEVLGSVDIAFYLGGALMLLTALFCLLGAGRETAAPQAGKKALSLRELRPQRLLHNYYFIAFFFVFILINVAKDFGVSYFSYLLAELGRSSSDVGLLNGLKAAAEVPLMFAAGWLVRRFGYRTCIFSVGILYAAEHLCYAFANSMGILIGAQILHGAFSGLFMGISASYLYTLIPASLSTTAHALAIAGSNVLSVLGNLGSGYLLESAGVRTLYQCIAVPPALAVLIFAVTLMVGKARHIAPYDSTQDALECALGRPAADSVS